MSTLDAIRCDDMNFPHTVLAGSKTALVLFCAAFKGNQDALWVADAGLTATCVDEDPIRLDEMRPLYPDDWVFVRDDAYKFAEMTEHRVKWDVVTLDPWTNEFNRCARNIDRWCRLANHAVIIGTGRDTVIEAPTYWEITDVRKRSDYDGGVYWTVLERM